MAGRTDEALRVEELQARARELDADPGHKAATVNRAVRVRVRAASRGAAYVRLPTLARGPRNVTRASPPNSSARRPSIRRRASSLRSKRSRFRAHRCVPRLQRRLPRSRYRQLPSDISPGSAREASSSIPLWRIFSSGGVSFPLAVTRALWVLLHPEGYAAFSCSSRSTTSGLTSSPDSARRTPVATGTRCAR